MTEPAPAGALDRPATHAPTLSVIIPVYNGTGHLQKCLAALAASDYKDYDVLVVDDGSTEPVAPVAAHHGFGYMRIDGPSGPARARNLGAASASGRYLVFIDADVCVHCETLARFAATFDADPTIDAVVGCYDDTPAATNFISQYKNLLHHYVHQSSEGNIPTFWSGCGAIQRELFLTRGGFDAERYRRPAIEDIEFGTWLSANGHRIVLDRGIQATHLKRWTLRNLIKTDIFDRGVPWMRLMLRAGRIANTLNVKPTQRLSVLLVYLLILSILAIIWWPMAAIGSGMIALVMTRLNLHLYRFFATRLGLWFALRAIPLHWLYFSYCGFCVLWGALLHGLERRASLVSGT